MAIEFFKYQGTGNDFIIIDNRTLNFSKNNTILISQLCNRKFGIGADGLLLLEEHPTAHFRMIYYNADGRESSMCGNGGRCMVHFAHFLGIIASEARFEAVDGTHTARIQGDVISLQMGNVSQLHRAEDYVFLDTGSPHHVKLVEDVSQYEVYSEGKKIRNETYGSEGANVNFVSRVETDIFSVRTYERGVEDETLSCGTGVTAVALAMHALGETRSTEVALRTPGGELKVSFRKTAQGYEDIFLIGPATQVFKGIWQ